MSYSNIKKLVIVCLLGALIVWVLYPFIYAILFASLLAIILAPVQKKLEVHIGKHRSSFFLALVILLGVFIPLLIIVSYAIHEIILYVQNIQSLSESSKQLGDYLIKIPYIGDQLDQKLNDFIAIIQKDQEKILKNIDQVLPALKYVGFTSLSFITNFLITLLVMYQFLVSGTTVEQFFKKVVLKDFNDRDNFIEAAINTTRRVSIAIISTAVLVGIIMGTTFITIGLPSPVLFAFICALASMIPFMVSIVYIALAFGIFVLLGSTKAIIVLVIGFGLNMFTDNIMQPKIINKGVTLSFAASLLGILGGLQAFGFIGIFLGPVIFNVAYVGLEKLMDNKDI
ncbi:AI-2E family transporter [Francisella adeliensis]|uniref:AI-2E family transporter n=1 Tax=Francisella adeliensis TaxID=2007306 RepID=A0A2Z4XXW4_9GAMM|nr:AI-2E family transporter [Francisella adeliensis]AXA33731.1 AI-2E family transporter [Francisella adeliensis]MBK2085627.1 AI-2E family transporter [Francisella adeliensis]MBK2097505.1 AI-2E family transporter [Francisella adeliensis]QIW11965.1 AI-2E family transporter [Francisella adeliensis]QIW13841.1 AI-2E family transporter [Francisella adeliensis]